MSYNDVSHETVILIWPHLADIPYDVYEQIEIEAKYSGYSPYTGGWTAEIESTITIT